MYVNHQVGLIAGLVGRLTAPPRRGRETTLRPRSIFTLPSSRPRAVAIFALSKSIAVVQDAPAPFRAFTSSSADCVPVYADFSRFFFAGNNGDSDNKRTCPGSAFECIPPSVCSFDGRTEKHYCCASGSSDAICWGPSHDVGGSDDTTPSGSQQLCAVGNTDFCCLKSSETCTERTNQFNICWSTLQNPIAELNATRVNETFHSLSSARPSASSYAISLSALQTMTSTTPGASTSSSSPTASSAMSTIPHTTTTSTSDADDSGLSGGAIGGIVGGVLGGLAILGIAAFLYWRRRKNSRSHPYEPTPSHTPLAYHGGEMDANQTYTRTPTEKYGHAINPVVEAPANHALIELPAGSTYQK